MDKFMEMMQKMMAMSDADRKMMMEKNKAMCTCGKCPTYDECARDKKEALFCAVGKSSCTLSSKACICPTCPVTPVMGLTKGYYCLSGSEKEQRGI